LTNPPNARDSTEKIDVVSAAVEYAAHVTAFALLSWSVWLVAEEALFDLLESEARTARGYMRMVNGASPLMWTAVLGTLFGVAVVGFIRSLTFVHCVDAALGTVLRHTRPPFTASKHVETNSVLGATRISSSVVLSIVMFVHAGMEGIVLGLIYTRPVFLTTFWSVALHNIPEGLIMAVPVFSELRKAQRSAAANGHQPEPVLWRGFLKSSFAALWSHAGQATTFLWIASSLQLQDALNANDKEGALGGVVGHSAPNVGETFTTFLSIGSIIGTIAMEILPDVLDIPACLRPV
jgi:hypothetical protein